MQLWNSLDSTHHNELRRINSILIISVRVVLLSRLTGNISRLISEIA